MAVQAQVNEIEAAYPMSPMQQGLLFHSIKAPESGMYCVQSIYTMHGQLDDVSFEHAWQSVMNRHAILRTAFIFQDNPLQVVFRRSSMPILREDWSHLPATKQDQLLQEYLTHDKRRGFQPTEVPLMRLALFRKGAHEHILVWSLHHVLLDGWSANLVLQEVTYFYGAHREGRSVHLPDAKPFQSYIDWLEEQGRENGLAETYWRSALRGFEAATPLPAADGKRDEIGYERVSEHLPSTVGTMLAHLAAREHLTVYGFIVAMWGLLLSRYSGKRDVVFGSIDSGRPETLPGVEEMVGLFINTVPVRLQVNGAQSLIEWIRRIHRQQVEIRKYNYASLVDIQNWSDVPRGEPLFETILGYQNFVSGAVKTSASDDEGNSVSNSAVSANSNGLQVKFHHGVEQTNYPLAVQVMTPGGKMEVRLIGDRTIYSPEVLGRLLCHYRQLLQSAAEGPERVLGELEMLSAEEREQLLVEWNRTGSPYPEEKCMHRLFEEQADERPEAVAVLYGGTAVSYGELNRRASQSAHDLRRKGVSVDTRVAICLRRSPEMVAVLLGVLKAGGAYVPLDPAYPQERLRYMLQDSESMMLLTQSDLRGFLSSIARTVPVVEVDAAEAVWKGEPQHSLRDERLWFNPEQLAYVIYTSGSTGQPKGVGVAHRGAVNLVHAQWKIIGVKAGQRVLQFASPSFDASVSEWLMALSWGGTLVLAEREQMLEEGGLAKVLEEQLVDIVTLSPSMLRLVEELPKVQTLIVAGEVLPEGIKNRWCEGRRLINAYGPTETTVCATMSEPLGSGAAVIGKPIANVRVYVLDEEMEPVPVGVGGEIYIGGDGLARGYMNRGGMTAERFIPDPYGREAGGRLYRTGDLGRWRGDGQLEFVGRNDDQVKLRGYRIELGEIEARLLEHRQVSQAVVMVREDTPGDKRLVAYYTVANSQPDPGAEQLRYQLSSQLPEYMVPSAYVLLEALPLTVNGKVDRKALPEPEWGSKGGGYEGPQTPVEEILGGIWCEVLKLERVGREENFFSLGGHSLLATQIMSRVREAMRVEVPLRWLFEAPVLREFAVRLESARKDKTGEGMAALVRQEGRGRLRLSFAQQRLWFLDQLEPGSSAYNVPAALRMKGELDIWALAKSFTEIVRRHEVLRTVFVVEDGEAEQRIEEPGEVAVPVVDVSGLEEEGRESKARGVVEQEAGRAFDLRRGPLLRVRLVRLGEQEHVLLVNLHHIVTDGWSTAILVREFMVLYEVYCEDKASPLGELEIQYADYAVWQREWLQGEVLEKELGYWRTQLGGVEPLEMPTDYPRTAVASHRGGVVSFSLPEGLSGRVRSVSRREGVTLFMVLLAVWKVLLSRYSGQEDFAVGTDVANRNRLETEGLIGFFVNQLVLRGKLQGEGDFGRALEDTRQITLEAYAHQDLPFERLVEELSPERSLGRTPLFQVKLIMQNAPQGELGMSEVKLESWGVEHRTAKFDLTLIVEERGGRIAGVAEYAADLYEGGTVERMLGHWERLLECAVEDPERRISELEMLSAAEREQLLEGWNDTAVEYPRGMCVHELFEGQVEEERGGR